MFLNICLGEIQCFGDNYRIISFSRFAPAFSVCFNAHSQVCNSLSDKRNTQVDTHSLLDNYHFSKRSMLGGFPSLKDFFLSVPSFLGNPSWRAWVLASSLDRVPDHTCLIESTDLLLSIVRNLHCSFFLCPYTCPWPAAPEAGFSRCISRGEMHLTSFLFQVSDHHLLKSGVVSRFTFSNSLLNAQRQQWGFSCSGS